MHISRKSCFVLFYCLNVSNLRYNVFGPMVFRKVILAIAGGWVMEGQGSINNISTVTVADAT